MLGVSEILKRRIHDVDIIVLREDFERAKDIIDKLSLTGIDILALAEIRADNQVYRFFLDDEMLAKIKKKRLLGLSLPVIAVEDNIVFKAIVQRSEMKGRHDIEDIQHMMKNDIDMHYLRKRIGKLKVSGRVSAIVGTLIKNTERGPKKVKSISRTNTSTK